MEGVQKFFRHVAKESKSGTSFPSPNDSSYNFGGVTDALSSSDQSRVILYRPPRNMVSLWTCSKVSIIFFVAGVFVGYTLKSRVKRWASKLLKRLKDD
ncbi:hypothetical protein JCGZ_07529 [Jatropha curcas]|uniref:Uncharacterized protein n=1 Tax=Jatropha curcas TaxID=180498 RepID=A0A067KG23_JATCU|nr:uncharacterized protein LOC105638013 [Jatropha curcas]KDP33958.1 hypothetical protein JCGZ_07529 [Jatropha curcas]